MTRTQERLTGGKSKECMWPASYKRHQMDRHRSARKAQMQHAIEVIVIHPQFRISWLRLIFRCKAIKLLNHFFNLPVQSQQKEGRQTWAQGIGRAFGSQQDKRKA